MSKRRHDDNERERGRGKREKMRKGISDRQIHSRCNGWHNFTGFFHKTSERETNVTLILALLYFHVPSAKIRTRMVNLRHQKRVTFSSGPKCECVIYIISRVISIVQVFLILLSSFLSLPKLTLQVWTLSLVWVFSYFTLLIATSTECNFASILILHLFCIQRGNSLHEFSLLSCLTTASSLSLSLSLFITSKLLVQVSTLTDLEDIPFIWLFPSQLFVRCVLPSYKERERERERRWKDESQLMNVSFLSPWLMSGDANLPLQLTRNKFKY